MIFISFSWLFGSFIITNGTVTLTNANLEVKYDVTVDGGLDAGNSLILVGRSWNKTGYFNYGTSTVTFFTAQISTITGNTTFYTLNCEVPSKEIQFAYSSTQGIAGNFIINGALGSRIKLRSTLIGAKWAISLVSTQSVNFVDVMDSDALNKTITCYGSINSGNNNSNWIFALSSPVVSNLILKDLTGNVINSDQWTNKKVLLSSFVLTDADGDNIKYHLQISTKSDFSVLFFSTSSEFLSQGTTVFQLPDLSLVTTHYIRIWAEDPTPLFSSTITYFQDNPNFPARWGFDDIPPSAISNLTALTGSVDGDVKLSWSAPSDNSGEPVYEGFYEIKAATYQILSTNYDSVNHNPFYSFVYTLSTSAVTSGQSVGITITGLYPGTTYHFAIKTIDRAGNKSVWDRTQALNHRSSAPASDIPPSAPPGVTATPAGSSSIFVQWDLPPLNGTDDIDFYRVYYATFSFSSLGSGVMQITTVSHPSNSYTHTGLSSALTYYYRIVTVDKGSSGDLFSLVFESELSVMASTMPAPSAALKVTAVYDDRSENNKDNYGNVTGIEDADGVVTFQWPKVVGGGTIESYTIEVSTDINFSFFITSATLPSYQSTFTATGPKGYYLYARVKAKNTDGDVSEWTESDGIYINKKLVDGSASDWVFTAGSSNTVSIIDGVAFWRDGLFDQRTDQQSSTQLDISSFAVAMDEFNIYFFVGFNSTTTVPQFDGRNFIQILIDSENRSAERVFRGRGDRYEDSYSANVAAWEWLCEIVTGNDVFRVEDNLFSNRKYGKYTEGAGTDNSNSYYEVAMPLKFLGGSEKFLNKTIKFTVATFWNAGGSDGSIGDWSGATNSNIVDCITTLAPNTWDEVSDRIVDFYLETTFSSTGAVTAARGVLTTGNTIPDEPEPPVDGISPSPPKALDYILYNIFVDAFYNGDTSNDDIADINDYGGDFEGVIKKVNYLNELGINVAYFAPVTEFGGGIWGFNIDDAFKHETKFGGTKKYIEMVKVLKRRNIETMIDWVCGQVGSKDSPTAKKHPDFFQQEQFGWGTKQEYAEPRAFWLNNMVWYFSISHAFRYDNPKFWDNGFGPEAFEFNRALRKISDRWDPQLYIMGEIPEQVEGWDGINAFTGGKGDSTHPDPVGGFGPMIHGGQDLRSGGYKNNRSAHICSWVRPGIDQRSTVDAINGIRQQQEYWKNQWSINPIFMESHDEMRLINRGRADDGAAWIYDSQIAYMTAITVGPSVNIMYGGELGLEGPYDGWQKEKMDVNGNVRLMPFERVNQEPYASVRNAIRRTVQARANFSPFKSEPKKGGWTWLSFTPDPAGDDVMVYRRNYGTNENVICAMNRSAAGRTISNLNTGIANETWKDWLTDETFTSNASGIIASLTVNSHYGRILIRGGYDWCNVTGTVTSGGIPVKGAIVDIDGKSHWTVETDSNGKYSISGDLYKVLAFYRGQQLTHTMKAWAPGYNISKIQVNFGTGAFVNNVVNFDLTPDNTPPSAPKELGGYGKDRACMLSWQPNAEEDFESYLIYRSTQPIPDGSTPEPIFETLKPFYYDNDLDNGLTNGVTYYYRVKAVDRNGNKSGFSNEVAVVPGKIKVKFWIDLRDEADVNVRTSTAVYISGGALTFGNASYGSWPAPVIMNRIAEGVFEKEFEFDRETFIEYKYVVDSKNGGARIWEGQTGYAFFDGSQADKNRGELMDDAVPDFEVIDQGGGRMIVADVWRYYYDRAPKPPANLTGNASKNLITVRWDKNLEPDLKYYVLQRSSWTSTFSPPYVEVMLQENSFVNTNLVTDNTYYFRVKAVDNSLKESGWSSVLSVYVPFTDITPPSAPQGLKATGYGSDGLSGVKISWTKNPEGDLAGYNIYRATYSGFIPSSSNRLNQLLISPQTTSYIDTSIFSGTSYYYKLIAIDDSSNSSNPSEELFVRLIPVTFNIDIGDINPASVEINGTVEPFDTPKTLTKIDVSSWAITLGFISGTTIYYKYSYNGSVSEDEFNTNSKMREFLVPNSTITVYNDWEENPYGVTGIKGYAIKRGAFLVWDKNIKSEDLKGYNIYRSQPPSTTPTIKLNSVPVTNTYFRVENLPFSNVTYYFEIRSVDGGNTVYESTYNVSVSVYVSSTIYVSFGVPYHKFSSTTPWGDENHIELYVAIMSSSDISVWDDPSRASITNGLFKLQGIGGAYTGSVELPVGYHYNFIFFAKTTSNPPPGLKQNTVYYDTVQDTGTFTTSTSTSTINPLTGVVAYFSKAGESRDARRFISIAGSVTPFTTVYVFANFGSTPTAPTYISAAGYPASIKLKWDAPYGAPWMWPPPETIGNIPNGAGESMKAVDVISNGVYKIYVSSSISNNLIYYTTNYTVKGSSFEFILSNSNYGYGVSATATYYFIILSSDPYGGNSFIPNIYSNFSSTVSATLSNAHIVAKFRVNKGASHLFKGFRKRIAVEEWPVSSWIDRSSLTGGSAAMMDEVLDDVEYSMFLTPFVTYNFILFAYSTYSVPGIIKGTTYYDTVPNTNDEAGMVVSLSSTAIIKPDGVNIWCGNVGATGDTRRNIYIGSIASGTTIYIFTNFSSTPTLVKANAFPKSSATVSLSWAPYGAWGTGSEEFKAVDVIAGGFYHIYRSSISGAGPWELIFSTSSMDYIDSGLTKGVTYYYVIVSSDCYSNIMIPNLYRPGAPEFSSFDAKAKPDSQTPAYFRVRIFEDIDAVAGVYSRKGGAYEE